MILEQSLDRLLLKRKITTAQVIQIKSTTKYKAYKALKDKNQTGMEDVKNEV